MAISKSLQLLASLLLSLVLLHLVQAGQTVMMNPGGASVKPAAGEKMDCGGACKARCMLSSRPNLCHRACGTCCARCNCVPPGTAGNEDVCPCYATMTTHGGRRKCP